MIYEPNPFEYSSLCAVTSWSHHIGLILSLSRFEETSMAPILFRAQKGHDPVCQTFPPTFSNGWRHIHCEEDLIIDSLTDAVSYLQSTQPSFVVLFSSNQLYTSTYCAVFLVQFKMSEQFFNKGYFESCLLHGICSYSSEKVKFTLDFRILPPVTGKDEMLIGWQSIINPMAARPAIWEGPLNGFAIRNW